MSIFDKFNQNVDIEGLKEDVKTASEGGGDFKEVPHGTYEVEVEKLEPKMSKSGKPMLSIWFKILDGEFENNRLFYNQVIHTGFGIHMANEMLRSLESDVEIDFEDFVQYEQLMMDVYENINGRLEYAIDYTANKKNPQFNDFKIIEVFEV